MNKPNGQFVIAPHQVAEFARAAAAGENTRRREGIGSEAGKYGPANLCDVQNSDLAMLLKRFGKFKCILWSAATGLMSGKFITIGSA